MRTTPGHPFIGIAVVLLAGCGVSLQPRVGPGASDLSMAPVPFPGVGPRAFPTPDASPGTPGDGVLRRVCRTSGVPGGWIAIRYVADVEECPTSPDAENDDTAAVIQRYSDKPVGTVLTVCADQGIPGGWVRERDPETPDGCPGARVGEGDLTTRVIRRVR